MFKLGAAEDEKKGAEEIIKNIYSMVPESTARRSSVQEAIKLEENATCWLITIYIIINMTEVQQAIS